MKIEDVEALAEKLKRDPYPDVRDELIDQAMSALRAEAWHPIEKAAELGAKDGRDVLARYNGGTYYFASWEYGRWQTDTGTFCDSDLTHFRFFNPPEGA